MVRISLAVSREERTLTQPCKDKKLRSYSPRYLYPKHVIMGSPSRGLPSSYLPLLYVTANSVFSRRCLSFLFLSPSPRVLFFVALCHALHPFRTFRRPSRRLSRFLSRSLPILAACPGQATHFSFPRNRKQRVYERDISRDILRFREYTGVRTFLLVLVSFE